VFQSVQSRAKQCKNCIHARYNIVITYFFYYGVTRSKELNNTEIIKKLTTEDTEEHGVKTQISTSLRPFVP